MRLSSGHLLLLLIFNSVFSQNCNNNSNSKTDCGYTGITQDQCESKGCCWFPVQNANGIPWCFYGSDYIKGYQASNVQTSNSGLEADLTLVQGSNMYGEDIASLHLSVYYETESRLRVKIYDPNTERWEVPYVVQPTSKAIKGPSTTDYTFSYTSFPFGFAVIRTSTDEVLFNTTIQPTPSYNGLIFEDQYLEISSILPNNHNIYGLGEHIRPLKLDPQTYTLFNADHGTPANMNLYGSHPFYLDTRPSGNVHGVFLLNSNGMDIVLQENSLTYKVIGGILDFYFFTGPTPDSVIVQYTDLIGKPYMIPYWVLGFHQCRWGYKNIQEVETVVQNYKINDIPLEAIWTDIDYMDQYLDFTFDPVNFPPAQMKQFVDNLHKNNQHYVIITDPGIHNQTGYAPFDLGNQMDVWIKDVDGQPLIGKVWPGTTTFPDWTRSNAADYWYQNIKNFHDVAAFDGLWIDMNEISNFCNGNCESKTIPNSVSGFDPNNPPYAINNRNEHAALDQFTIRMDAVHNISIEYNVHNLFGMLEAIATQKALEKVRGQRALVISRSTFPSSGHYGGHWTGDVTSAWSDLYYTIPDMINFNFYGIPLIGADICGFNGNTTEELCARWIELGAFYPFCRDHNAIDQISQELYVWPLVANISRNILNVRYSLLPYYYTLFYQTHTGLVGTVIRPLFFEFPQDSATYAIDKQFLVGEGLMVSPVVTEGATTVDVYFPEGQWYDFFTQEPVTYSGETVTLQSPIDTVQVHVRGGIVIPMQTPSYTLTESRLNPYSLLAALDESGKASGELYLDDGESLDAISGGHFTYISYQVSSSNANGKMTASVGSIGFNPANSLQTVTIMGVQLSPSNVYMNGQAVNFSYTKTSKVLVISLKANMLQSFSITWF